MSSAAGRNYTVKNGDTLQRIAAVFYGNQSLWRKIYDANIKTIGPNPDLLIAGATLFIPPEEEKIEQAAQAAAVLNPSGSVTVILDGRELLTTQGRFACGVDTLASSWNADILWNPGDDPDLDRATAPGSFADSLIYLMGSLVGTGRLYTRTNHISPNSITKNLVFYSTSKDIVDGYLSLNFEYAKSDLRQIAEAVCSEIGFRVKFPDGAGDAYEAIEGVPAYETIGKFFQRLAAARGLFVSCDEASALIFQKLHGSGPPVAHIDMTGRIATAYEAAFDDTQRFNNYIATSTAGDGKGLDGKTFIDPQVPRARQFIFEAPECDAKNLDTAALWAMLKITLKANEIKIPTDKWTDESGALWKPNTVVTLKSPVIDTAEARKYIIRAVEFAWSASARSAQLSLVPILGVDGSGKLVME
jgi:prophage tail gpP-like protein